MKLNVNCESRSDEQKIAAGLIVVGKTFSYNAATRDLNVYVDSMEQAIHIGAKVLPTFDLEESYTCKLLENVTKKIDLNFEGGSK